MKTIGILGGMSVASTQTYYRELARLTRDRLGGLHSPELLIRSVDFDRIAELQAAADWSTAGHVLNAEALAMERGGAQLLLLATNTMHKVADKMVDGLQIPLLHIADATADIIAARGLKRPGLMATAFTMEQAFYIDRLKAKDLIPLVPEADDRSETHRIIYGELCRDVISEDSRAIFESIAERLVARGCDCLILGCTEIGMLLSQANVSVPVFDTTLIHCEAALSAALT